MLRAGINCANERLLGLAEWGVLHCMVMKSMTRIVLYCMGNLYRIPWRWSFWELTYMDTPIGRKSGILNWRINNRRMANVFTITFDLSLLTFMIVYRVFHHFFAG